MQHGANAELPGWLSRKRYIDGLDDDAHVLQVGTDPAGEKDIPRRMTQQREAIPFVKWPDADIENRRDGKAITHGWLRR